MRERWKKGERGGGLRWREGCDVMGIRGSDGGGLSICLSVYLSCVLRCVPSKYLMDEYFSEVEFSPVTVVPSPCPRMVRRSVWVRMGSVFVALQKRVVRTLGIGGSERGERVSGRGEEITKGESGRGE